MRSRLSMSPISYLLYHRAAWMMVLCLPMAAATKKAPSAKPVPPDVEGVQTPVLFTGLPASIELPARTLKSFLWKVEPGTVCDSFTLVPYVGTLQTVHVTASGLGMVDFSLSGHGFQRDQLVIPDLQPNGATVYFCVRGNSLLQPASSAKGSLIAFVAGYKPATVDIRMDRPSLAPWITTLGWFVAILVPVVLTAIFAILSTWATSSVGQRREQKTAFRKMKDDKWDELADFFQTYLRNLLAQCQNDQEFVKVVRSELQTRGYWSSIPWKERDRIERSIKQREALHVMSELASLFREWDKPVSELHK